MSLSTPLWHIKPHVIMTSPALLLHISEFTCYFVFGLTYTGMYLMSPMLSDASQNPPATFHPLHKSEHSLQPSISSCRMNTSLFLSPDPPTTLMATMTSLYIQALKSPLRIQLFYRGIFKNSREQTQSLVLTSLRELWHSCTSSDLPTLHLIRWMLGRYVVPIYI